ncbi:MAG: Nif3-like dinuclear metal center hexameric protein [Syntrophomonas sp.]
MAARVKDIVKIMEEFFPLFLAESWDNSGLQLGSAGREVERAVVALDLDESIVELAVNSKAGLIITHHPLFFNALKKIDFGTPQGRLTKQLIQADISVYSAHTNLDAAEKGLNQHLAELLGLKDIKPLDKNKQEDLFKLVVFVPNSHVESVRQALAQAGAGYLGAYSDCSFRTPGTGAFRPQAGSNPFIGTAGQLEEVEEYRLETVVYRRDLNRVLQVMKQAHPYEEVAYDLFHMVNEGKVFSLGRKGRWDKEMDLKECAEEVKRKLGLESVRVVGDLKQKIRKVAVVSGAGASFMNKAIRQNIDLMITGDLKYHEAQDALAQGLCVIDAGHQGTEEIMVPYLCRLLEKETQAKGYQIDFIPAFIEACFKTL